MSDTALSSLFKLACCTTCCVVVQVSKSRSGPAPAVLVPHGGPHSAVAANFYMPFVLLAARGYSIVAVNFRGSLGFGEAGVQALPGHIGHYDVEDCIAALDAAVAGGELTGICVRHLACG
jgi:acylaminoacyl-peptidase